MTELNRRRFLRQVGAGVAVAALGSPYAWSRSERKPAERPTGSLLASDGLEPDWAAVKQSFGLNPSAIHWSGFYLASHPAPVKAAIEKHRAGMDLNPLAYISDNQKTLEDATWASAAEYLGVEADQIALTDSTTMGLGLLYNGIQIAPGQEIVSTTLQAPARRGRRSPRSTAAGGRGRPPCRAPVPVRCSVSLRGVRRPFHTT